MPANSFGQIFRITTFGESHGPALGVVIDGCPAGVPFDEPFLRLQLRRRRPGQSQVTTSRTEADEPEVLSGVFNGRTLGTPIAILVRNHDQRSEDYDKLRDRRGHADDVWRDKFVVVDPRGGGRSSGRETVGRVIGGAVAQMVLHQLHPPLQILSYTVQIGKLRLDPSEVAFVRGQASLEEIENSVVKCPIAQFSEKAERLLLAAKHEGKSYGGLGELIVRNMPRGLGQPVFHKLKSDLAQAITSLGATRAVEFGAGFGAASAEGSQYHAASEDPYGGLRGGISTGEPLILRVTFQPPASVLDVAKKGRHDPCIVLRALPVVEAMVALVLVDHVLWRRLDQLTTPL